MFAGLPGLTPHRKPDFSMGESLSLSGIDAEEDEAKCGLHALHAVGFAKEGGQQGGAIVYAGNRGSVERWIRTVGTVL